jgi:hypothetical protein
VCLFLFIKLVDIYKSKIHLLSPNLSRILRMVTVVRKVKITVTKYLFVSQYGHRSNLDTFSADVAYH